MTGRPYVLDWALPARAQAPPGTMTGLGAWSTPRRSTSLGRLRESPPRCSRRSSPARRAAPALAAAAERSASHRRGVCRCRCRDRPGRSRTRTCTPCSADARMSPAPTPAPVRPFGFGLSYTTFAHDDAHETPASDRRGRDHSGRRCGCATPASVAGDGCRAAVCARRGRERDPPGRPAAGLPAGHARSPAPMRSSSSTCRSTDSPSRDSTA